MAHEHSFELATIWSLVIFGQVDSERPAGSATFPAPGADLPGAFCLILMLAAAARPKSAIKDGRVAAQKRTYVQLEADVCSHPKSRRS
jgi:hypothetical protein